MQKVIFVTDGDAVAVKAILAATKALALGCVVLSGGNPTCCTYEDLRKKVLTNPNEVAVVLFDDAGQAEVGPGEQLMERLSHDKGVNVIGALAVSSADRAGDWTMVDVSIDRYSRLVAQGVDKEGLEDIEDHRVHGDTVYILDQLNIPIIVGIGDLGKMGGKDDTHHGAPITQKALKLILERSGSSNASRK